MNSVLNGSYGYGGPGLYMSSEPKDASTFGSCRIDVTLPAGTRVVRNATEALVSLGLFDSKSSGTYYATLNLIGTQVPFIVRHLVWNVPWAVLTSNQLVQNASLGPFGVFNSDLWSNLFGRLYPSYRGAVALPNLAVINNNLALLRRFFATQFAAGDLLSFSMAVVQRPDAPWDLLVPGATEQQWQQLEHSIARLFLDWKPEWSVPIPDGEVDEAFLDRFFKYFIPEAFGGPEIPSQSDAALLRSEPMQEVIYATAPYLRELEAYKFVSVNKSERVQTILTSRNVSVDIYKAVIRRVSAYEESDWNKLLSSRDIYIVQRVKEIMANSAVNEQDKTQQLIRTVIVSFLNRGSSPDVIEFFRACKWLHPVSPRVVPPWISHAVMNAVAWFLKDGTANLDSFGYTYQEPDIIDNYFQIKSNRASVDPEIMKRFWSNPLNQLIPMLFGPTATAASPAQVSKILSWGFHYGLPALYGKGYEKVDDWAAALSAGQPLGDAVRARNWPLAFSITNPGAPQV